MRRAGVLSRLSPGKLGAIFGLISVVPLCLLAYFSISQASSAVEQEVEARVSSTSTLSAEVVREEMEGLKRLVDSYAARPSVVAALRDDTRTPAESALLRRHLAELRARSCRHLHDLPGRARRHADRRRPGDAVNRRQGLQRPRLVQRPVENRPRRTSRRPTERRRRARVSSSQLPPTSGTAQVNRSESWLPHTASSTCRSSRRASLPHKTSH